jgi:hypothetical protein
MQAPQPTPQLTQNDAAALCKSQPSQIAQLTQGLATCRSSTESQRTDQLLFSIDDTLGFFTGQTAVFNDLMATGDTFFGTSPSASAVQEVSQRNKDLKKRQTSLVREVRQSTSRMEQMERDFIDGKETLPDSLPNQTIHVLEDYTLVVLLAAYLFGAVAILMYYIVSNGYGLKAILISTAGVSVVSIFLFVLGFIFL